MLNLQHSEKPPPLGMRAPTMGPGSPLLRVFVYAPASSEAHSPLLPRTLPPLNPVCLGCIILCASKKKKKNAAHYLPHAIMYSCTPITSVSSVQFSCSVVSDSLWPHGLQHGQASLSITNSRSFIFHCPIFLPFHTAQGKNTEVVCHSLLQWTTFCQNPIT